MSDLGGFFLTHIQLKEISTQGSEHEHMHEAARGHPTTKARSCAYMWGLNSACIFMSGFGVKVRWQKRKYYICTAGYPIIMYTGGIYSFGRSPRYWSRAEARLRTRTRLVVRLLMGTVCVTRPPPGVLRPMPAGVWRDVRWGVFIFFFSTEHSRLQSEHTLCNLKV